MKYAELLVEWLHKDGYTHCFFVAGGNNMHLLDGVRKRMKCVPFVHEVAAGIAAEYFNESSNEGRAFALVTAGPGLTNITTAVAGAFLESRELLVIGGQVKSTDLSSGGIRQRGIQEVDGIALVKPVCVSTLQITTPVSQDHFLSVVRKGRSLRKGPVFVEICLDAQAAPVERAVLETTEQPTKFFSPPMASKEDFIKVSELIAAAERPIILLGGGLSRKAVDNHREHLLALGIPIMTSWNAMDRIGSEDSLYFGRPNTWGQRYSNILLQSSDLLIAIGARLGLQQTGFNWEEFASSAKVVQIDIDSSELAKGHPRIDLPIHADANEFLNEFIRTKSKNFTKWVIFCDKVKASLPLSECSNSNHEGFWNPYDFSLDLSNLCSDDDILIPCSSGGSMTVTMQSFNQKQGQIITCDKNLASMGYGLSGSIGSSLAHLGRRVILIEGDGGFSQNIQELATVNVQNLPIKMFILANEGYASIRMTQRNYFHGDYLGCDTSTGLGFPNWEELFSAYEIPVLTINKNNLTSEKFKNMFSAPGPAAFIVNVHPERAYYPKISSTILRDGGMRSNPLHLLSPELSEEKTSKLLKYTRG